LGVSLVQPFDVKTIQPELAGDGAGFHITGNSLEPERYRLSLVVGLELE
jgi:hypothetical protein